MLHWPDSMFAYLTEDEVLFSNDGFGQHYASEHMFNDRVDQNDLFQECIKYYANILTPFSPMGLERNGCDNNPTRIPPVPAVVPPPGRCPLVSYVHPPQRL